MPPHAIALSRPARAMTLPLRLWMALSHNRNALAKLDSRLLADIGITPDMARSECARPFWDVPAHWRG